MYFLSFIFEKSSHDIAKIVWLSKTKKMLEVSVKYTVEYLLHTSLSLQYTISVYKVNECSSTAKFFRHNSKVSKIYSPKAQFVESECTIQYQKAKLFSKG